MSRRGWFLFILVGFLWGVPYLFIKIAVDPENGFSPAAVVCLRTAIGAAILIPLAIRQGQLGAAIRGIKYVAPYALLEIIGPWILIGTAEQKISSGLAGLLIASVPIWATIFASMRGDKTVWHHKRLLGIVVGFIGLIAVVGFESIAGGLAASGRGSALRSTEEGSGSSMFRGKAERITLRSWMHEGGITSQNDAWYSQRNSGKSCRSTSSTRSVHL